MPIDINLMNLILDKAERCEGVDERIKTVVDTYVSAYGIQLSDIDDGDKKVLDEIFNRLNAYQEVKRDPKIMAVASVGLSLVISEMVIPTATLNLTIGDDGFARYDHDEFYRALLSNVGHSS